ncbi:FixH family protein [Niabella drilacis]|uniref:FixH protein n=1 Tax=Niabella drilacis (strain DSM 25811 / CCM 8410 / CCUG 62505 / LMG 26954 / E90) TaxID=1285928 RepID=A0A1G6ZI38_NIADE|nr:FixH family protein [Niabella drilacis]SDE02309.1 FixH protein [Niabella drilacis]
MNWGIRVVIILALFLAGMTYMVALAMRQTNETIDADYYSKELKYQKVIDGKKQLAALAQPVMISDSAGGVWVRLPEIAVQHLDSGHIEFLRLSSSKADRRIPMAIAGKSVYSLPLASFVKGWYRVRIEWISKGVDYYHEQNFQIR